MLSALRILMAILGAAALLVSLAVMIFGPTAVVNFSETQFSALTGVTAPLSGAWPAAMDNEMRFYAPFFGNYGLMLLIVAHDLPRNMRYVPVFAILFFVGGIGRAISYVTVGAPHPVFVALMAIELILPPILLILWTGARGKARK